MLDVGGKLNKLSPKDFTQLNPIFIFQNPNF
jgi:hypothetical protein